MGKKKKLASRTPSVIASEQEHKTEKTESGPKENKPEAEGAEKSESQRLNSLLSILDENTKTVEPKQLQASKNCPLPNPSTFPASSDKPPRVRDDTGTNMQPESLGTRKVGKLLRSLGNEASSNKSAAKSTNVQKQPKKRQRSRAYILRLAKAGWRVFDKAPKCCIGKQKSLTDICCTTPGNTKIKKGDRPPRRASKYVDKDMDVNSDDETEKNTSEREEFLGKENVNQEISQTKPLSKSKQSPCLKKKKKRGASNKLDSTQSMDKDSEGETGANAKTTDRQNDPSSLNHDSDPSSDNVELKRESAHSTEHITHRSLISDSPNISKARRRRRTKKASDGSPSCVSNKETKPAESKSPDEDLSETEEKVLGDSGPKATAVCYDKCTTNTILNEEQQSTSTTETSQENSAKISERKDKIAPQTKPKHADSNSEMVDVPTERVQTEAMPDTNERQNIADNLTEAQTKVEQTNSNHVPVGELVPTPPKGKPTNRRKNRLDARINQSQSRSCSARLGCATKMTAPKQNVLKSQTPPLPKSPETIDRAHLTEEENICEVNKSAVPAMETSSAHITTYYPRLKEKTCEPDSGEETRGKEEIQASRKLISTDEENILPPGTMRSISSSPSLFDHETQSSDAGKTISEENDESFHSNVKKSTASAKVPPGSSQNDQLSSVDVAENSWDDSSSSDVPNSTTNSIASNQAEVHVKKDSRIETLGNCGTNESEECVVSESHAKSSNPQVRKHGRKKIVHTNLRSTSTVTREKTAAVNECISDAQSPARIRTVETQYSTNLLPSTKLWNSSCGEKSASNKLTEFGEEETKKEIVETKPSDSQKDSTVKPPDVSQNGSDLEDVTNSWDESSSAENSINAYHVTLKSTSSVETKGATKTSLKSNRNTPSESENRAGCIAPPPRKASSRKAVSSMEEKMGLQPSIHEPKRDKTMDRKIGQTAFADNLPGDTPGNHSIRDGASTMLWANSSEDENESSYELDETAVDEASDTTCSCEITSNAQEMEAPNKLLKPVDIPQETPPIGRGTPPPVSSVSALSDTSRILIDEFARKNPSKRNISGPKVPVEAEKTRSVTTKESASHATDDEVSLNSWDESSIQEVDRKKYRIQNVCSNTDKSLCESVNAKTNQWLPKDESRSGFSGILKKPVNETAPKKVMAVAKMATKSYADKSRPSSLSTENNTLSGTVKEAAPKKQKYLRRGKDLLHNGVSETQKIDLKDAHDSTKIHPSGSSDNNESVLSEEESQPDELTQSEEPVLSNSNSMDDIASLNSWDESASTFLEPNVEAKIVTSTNSGNKDHCGLSASQNGDKASRDALRESTDTDNWNEERQSCRSVACNLSEDAEVASATTQSKTIENRKKDVFQKKFQNIKAVLSEEEDSVISWGTSFADTHQSFSTTDTPAMEPLICQEKETQLSVIGEHPAKYAPSNQEAFPNSWQSLDGRPVSNIDKNQHTPLETGPKNLLSEVTPSEEEKRNLNDTSVEEKMDEENCKIKSLEKKRKRRFLRWGKKGKSLLKSATNVTKSDHVMSRREGEYCDGKMVLSEKDESSCGPDEESKDVKDLQEDSESEPFVRESKHFPIKHPMNKTVLGSGENDTKKLRVEQECKDPPKKTAWLQEKTGKKKNKRSVFLSDKSYVGGSRSKGKRVSHKAKKVFSLLKPKKKTTKVKTIKLIQDKMSIGDEEECIAFNLTDIEEWEQENSRQPKRKDSSCKMKDRKTSKADKPKIRRRFNGRTRVDIINRAAYEDAIASEKPSTENPPVPPKAFSSDNTDGSRVIVSRKAKKVFSLLKPSKKRTKVKEIKLMQDEMSISDTDKSCDEKLSNPSEAVVADYSDLVTIDNAVDKQTEMPEKGEKTKKGLKATLKNRLHKNAKSPNETLGSHEQHLEPKDRKLKKQAKAPTDKKDQTKETETTEPKVSASSNMDDNKAESEKPEVKPRPKSDGKLLTAFKILTAKKTKNDPDEMEKSQNKKDKRAKKKKNSKSTKELPQEVTTAEIAKLTDTEPSPTEANTVDGEVVSDGGGVKRSSDTEDDQQRVQTSRDEKIQQDSKFIGPRTKADALSADKQPDVEKKASEPKVTTYKRNAVKDVFYSLQHKADKLTGKVRRHKIDLRNRWRDFLAGEK